MNYKQIEKEEAIEFLKSYIKKGMTLHSIIRYVSNSGMSRNISFKLINSADTVTELETIDLSYQIAKVLEYPFNDRYHAVRVKGSGMDMAFHVVENLSRILFDDGKQLKSNIL
tara:strand:+ start:262 stop:600 length:339 start_codon:yes stop_codon:yes gene_type:complete